MAKLYPSLDTILKSKPYPEDGELEMLEFLSSTLDDSYEVYFQPFLNGEKPDIIFLKPGLGIFIIEVKDWNLNSYSFNGKDFIVNSNSQHIKSPFSQVSEYKDNLYKFHIDKLLYKKLENKNYYGLVKCMVFFSKATQNQVKNFMEKHYKNGRINYIDIIAKDDLNKDSFLKLIDRRFSQNSSFFTDDIYMEAIRVLKPPFHKYTDGTSINYTSNQKNLIISKKGSQKIKGVAGSGKTIILAKRAVNAHIRTGGKVLILTYNITLKNYIKDMLSKVRENFEWNNFTIINYHLFITNILNKNNVIMENCKDFNELEKKYFSNIDLFQYLTYIDKYDAIFIDEIQDYKKEWLDILKKYFLNSNGEFVLFGDEKQNLYNRETEDKKPKTNISGPWKSLNESFRLSEKLSKLAILFQNKYFKNKYDIDDFICIKTSIFDKESSINYYNFKIDELEKICTIINSKIIKGSIHPNDICIVGSTINYLRELDYIFRSKYQYKTNTVFETKEQYEELNDDKNSIDEIRRSKRYNFWMNGGNMKISTVHCFKGWEIVNLVVIIDKLDENMDELIYTACTRCINNLIVINLGNEKYEDFFNYIESVGGIVEKGNNRI